mmetsp:Transcript_6312/g.13905  ORF Transcript_6312/g.13905 Transcript_6312/m.13905 type:complete len:211 (-) Transcript_6312:2300-2932(-)
MKKGLPNRHARYVVVFQVVGSPSPAAPHTSRLRLTLPSGASHLLVLPEGAHSLKRGRRRCGGKGRGLRPGGRGGRRCRHRAVVPAVHHAAHRRRLGQVAGVDALGRRRGGELHGGRERYLAADVERLGVLEVQVVEAQRPQQRLGQLPGRSALQHKAHINDKALGSAAHQAGHIGCHVVGAHVNVNLNVLLGHVVGGLEGLAQDDGGGAH